MAGARGIVESMNQMKIEYLPVASLHPYERNAKQHPPEQVEHIANSIREFGFRQPLVVDAENVVVIGHGRLLAAEKLGLDTVPVVRADDLSEAQIKALRLADNKTNESGWDFTTLEAELDELSAEFDMADFGFDEAGETDETPQEAQEDDFDVDAPVEAKAKLGDIYQLGRHRLMCGDATSIGNIDKLMDGNIADIAITSPPYGESKSAKLRDHYVRGAQKRKSLYNDHEDNSDEWKDLIDGALNTMKAASNAQFINIQMLADNKRDLVRIIADHASELCDIIIWDKQNAAPQMQKNVLNNVFEFVFIFARENASRAIPYASWHGDKNNVIRLPVGTNEFADIHRAVFPVGFPAAIMDISNEAKTVLDVFGGTGTTLIAAEQLNRNCYMMELDPHYCDVIIARWEQFTGQKAVLLNG